MTTEEEMILVHAQERENDVTVEISPETSNEEMVLVTRSGSDIWIGDI